MPEATPETPKASFTIGTHLPPLCAVCKVPFKDFDRAVWDSAVGMHHMACKTGRDPAAGFRDAKGRIMPGAPAIGGRSQGSVDGIKMLKGLIGRHAAEMSVDDGDMDKLFEAMRKHPKGVKWMLEEVFGMFLKANAQATETVARNLHVIITRDLPPGVQETADDGS